MKTQFDKIYVISLVTNHDRQEFIKYQMNELGLDFEFVYGIDFKSLTNDAINLPITYPKVCENDQYNIPGNYGCTMTHYLAISQAYEFEYNSVLIIEDDVCFIKDKNLVEYYLNSIPKEADFVTWDPRFMTITDHNIFINKLKKEKHNNFLKLSNDNNSLCGGMLFGLMNRDIIKLYLDNQRSCLNMSDRVIGIWKQSIVNRYICSKCICTDQYNIFRNFSDKLNHISYINLYNKIEKLNTENFYKPKDYHIFCREDVSY